MEVCVCVCVFAGACAGPVLFNRTVSSSSLHKVNQVPLGSSCHDSRVGGVGGGPNVLTHVIPFTHTNL